MQHDFKMVLKRLAYEDSFSRDTHGGGPEHNMHLVPFMLQMLHNLLTNGSGNTYLQYSLQGSPESEGGKFSFLQQKRIHEFLEQGMK